MNDAVISSGAAWVESEGIFHLDARGEPAETGEGAGITSGSIGYGASHGGYGGGGVVATAEGISPYDNVKKPLKKGSGGGNGGGTGGSGGGLLHWKVGTNIEINGLLSLKGGAGSGGHSAGGSGGSLYIETFTMTGHGEINVRGGDGVNQGGGGAGGRIAIACEYRSVQTHQRTLL